MTYKEEDAAHLDYKALRVSTVLEGIQKAGCNLNLVILDACRSKPLPVRGAQRDLGRGLAKIAAPAGTVVAFACAPGATASDGQGRNGVFTANLLKHLGTPEDLDFVMGYVVEGVKKETGGSQVPFRDSSLTGRRPCCLVEAPKVVEAPVVHAAAPAEPPASPIDVEVAAFLESCRLDAGEIREAAAALRGIGVSSGSRLDLCEEEDLQVLKLPPVTLRVLRAGLKTRHKAVEREKEAAAKRAADAQAVAEAKIAAEKQAAAAMAAAEEQRAAAAKAQVAAKSAADAQAVAEAQQKKGQPLSVSDEAQAYLKQMEGKTTLDLSRKIRSDNSIGDTGASALAEALKANTTLTTLDLQLNSIGGMGARALRSSARVGCSVSMDDPSCYTVS